MKWALIVFTVLVSSCGDVLCAKGMSAGKELEVHDAKDVVFDVEYIFTRRLVLLGWLCYAAAFFSLVALLSVAKLTVAIPATAFSFVIDTIGAYYILHEHISWRRWIGVVCVTAGVIMAVQPSPPAPASQSSALSRAAGTNTAAVESCPVEPGNDQAGYHHGGAGEFHQQGARCEVLGKP